MIKPAGQTLNNNLPQMTAAISGSPKMAAVLRAFLTWQLRQAEYLTGFGIDIDFVITGPAGKSGHGAHFA